ncbi:DUF4221 family protein [Algoriphagus algorifonticola]|uniref:DUF4221 family protein n=1 Tax=Algoriphagus algorifonticola TaxID=2593007 RepID=UPI0011A37643|nr:DUF4221 family protein [Algoriphagus algorifonticola]
MRRLLFAGILFVTFSCNQKDSDKETARKLEITYSLDTVFVDAGDQFIHVNWSLTSSDLSKDEKYLYNFQTGAKEPGLEIINLEKLQLERIIPFYLDGPNSIRHSYFNKVYAMEDGTIYLSDNYDLYHFDLEGTKLENLNYAEHDFEGEKLPEDLRVDLNEALSEDGKTLVALYADKKLEKAPLGMVIFDLENKTFQYKPLEFISKMEKYRTSLYLPEYPDYPMGAILDSYLLQVKNDTLILSTRSKNELKFYSWKTDSLNSKTYESQFTSQEAKINFPKRVESQEEYERLAKETKKYVKYGPLMFDKKNNLYWRLSSEMDKMVGDSLVYKTVLTAFNKEFDQVSEVLLPKDYKIAYKTFVRDGMLYSFLNVDDEVAFVRIKPSISE